jgi:hypothetical protein
MNTLIAEQLLFTRVEAEFSPRRVNGFQTVWASPGLATEAVRQIEKHVQCWQPFSGGRRLQFFILSGGHVALARSEPVVGDPAIVGRRQSGLFGTHCLVLEREAFARVDNNPFAVFDSGLPVTPVERMISELGTITSSMPYREIQIGKPRKAAAPWASGEAMKLFDFATEAATLRRQRQIVLVDGSPAEVEDTLRLVFELLPRRKRLACTFTSSLAFCPIDRDAFWAVGGPIESSETTMVRVDAASRHVVASGATALSDTTGAKLGDLYGSWLRRALRCQPEALEVAARAEGIATVCELLDEDGEAGEEPCDPEALNDLAALCPGEVKDKLVAAGARRAFPWPRAQRLAEVGTCLLQGKALQLGFRERRHLRAIAQAAGSRPLLEILEASRRRKWRLRGGANELV